MKSYLEKVKLNAILAGELNKFEGIDARIVGAHSVLATYKGVDVCVEVISTDKIRCTRVSDGLSHERWLGQNAGWSVVETAEEKNELAEVTQQERWWQGELDQKTAHNWAIDLAAEEQYGPWTNYAAIKKAYSLSDRETELLESLGPVVGVGSHPCSVERRSFRCVVAKCNCVRGIGFFGVPICVKE